MSRDLNHLFGTPSHTARADGCGSTEEQDMAAGVPEDLFCPTKPTIVGKLLLPAHVRTNKLQIYKYVKTFAYHQEYS